MDNKPYQSTRVLNDLGLLGDVRRTNNFRLLIEGVTGEDNYLDLIIQRAFLPKVNLQVLELRHGNDAKKLAGVASWQGGQVTIMDVLSPKELNTLLKWFKQTYDSKTGAIGIAGEYKRKGYISEYAADGRLERRWPVEGLWISDLDPGVLDATNNSPKEITFTLQIDPPSQMEPEYFGYPTLDN